MTTVPDRSEAVEYYFRYIDLVPAGDIREALAAQQTEIRELLRGISENQSLHRYAPDKWSIREVVNHLSDTERLFGFRAFWFARGFDSPLPSFDQAIAVSAADADGRSWDDLVREFEAVRASTVAFFQNLPPQAWALRGTASGNPFTVRALAYLMVGHVTHHGNILREQYLGR